jgi:type I restriction enzyme S subunit
MEFLSEAGVIDTSIAISFEYVRIGTNFAAFPPRREQEAIAAFIDAKSAEVRATKDMLHRQIETIVAYRKSLIHECVTGQRRVTEADARKIHQY